MGRFRLSTVMVVLCKSSDKQSLSTKTPKSEKDVMSNKPNDSDAKTPYRAKIETGGKIYSIEDGPSEMRFLFNSTIFQSGSLKVRFTLSKLGEILCIITGFNKSFITEPRRLDHYMFFGRTDGGILIVGYYCLTQNRSGWMKFYTPEELQKIDPILAHILG